MIRKQSSIETVVTLHIHLYHNPLKFKVNYCLFRHRKNSKTSKMKMILIIIFKQVDPKLASIIGFDLCTRSTALAAIWEYIKVFFTIHAPLYYFICQIIKQIESFQIVQRACAKLFKYFNLLFVYKNSSKIYKIVKIRVKLTAMIL